MIPICASCRGRLPRMWLAQCSRQFAGFLGVMLRLSGVSSEDLRRLVVNREEIGPAKGSPRVLAERASRVDRELAERGSSVARALAEILGGPRLPKLTPEHEERLRLLELARTVRLRP